MRPLLAALNDAMQEKSDSASKAIQGAMKKTA